MTDRLQAFRAAILDCLGNAPDVIEPGRWQRFSTNGERGDTAGWSKLFDDLAGGVFGCYRRGVREAWSAGEPRLASKGSRLVNAKQVAEATDERMRLRNREWAANALRIDKVASECTALSSGDPVMCYLERRRCLGERPAPATLRLHPGLGYWEADRLIGTFPAMVAPLVAPDGRTVALHRTFLTDDGQKAPVPSAKKLTPAAGPIRGASIRLFGPERGVLGIAEGIETAMAATCASGVPTVAAYCADALAAWIWPPLVDHLIIFGDADKRGRDAAEALRQRALASGLRCRTLTPAVDGADWCDVWGTRPDRIAPNGGADDRDF